MAALRFTRWEVEDGTSLSALMPGGVPACGVYVLEFADGTEYVGQTVSLPSRLATHRRHWPQEITGLRFAQVVPDGLDDAERDVVARLSAAGVALRNRALVAMPLRGEALDLVVDRAVQAEWLAGQTEPLEIGDRHMLAAQRRRTARNYAELANRPDYPDVLAALCAYVRACLPWPHQTEGRFWSVTSLPGTGRSATWRRVVALIVNNVEVLVLGEWRELDSEWWPAGFLNIVGTATPRQSWGCQVEEAQYKTVGTVWRCDFEHPRELVALLGR